MPEVLEETQHYVLNYKTKQVLAYTARLAAQKDTYIVINRAEMLKYTAEDAARRKQIAGQTAKSADVPSIEELDVLGARLDAESKKAEADALANPPEEPDPEEPDAENPFLGTSRKGLVAIAKEQFGHTPKSNDTADEIATELFRLSQGNTKE